MERIGILGGTFDPIHLGHLEIARKAMSEAELSKVLFLVSGKPGYKEPAADAAVRLHRVELTVDGIPGFEASDIEVRREGLSYMSDSLRTLKTLYPDAAFFLILGSDQLHRIDRWHEADYVLENASLLVFMREAERQAESDEKCEDLRRRYNASIQLIRSDVLKISSTEIRRRIDAGLPIDGLVPECLKEELCLPKKK